MIRVYCCAAMMALLFGCATPQTVENQTSSEIATNVKFSRDEFKKIATLEGSRIEYSGGAVDDGSYWLFAARRDGEAQATFFVQFRSVRGTSWGWAFWETAHDETGLQLPVTELGREVGNAGITYEAVAVGVTRDYLTARAAAGIRIRVDGRRARKEIIIPAAYVQGFLSRVNVTFP